MPIPLRRSIGRISAILELVDLESERLLLEREEYKKLEYNNESDLNIEILKHILDNKLPKENKSGDEGYSDLLDDLKHSNIKTAGQLIQLIDKGLSYAIKLDNEIVERIKKNDEAARNFSRLAKGVFFKHGGLIREMMKEYLKNSDSSAL